VASSIVSNCSSLQRLCWLKSMYSNKLATIFGTSSMLSKVESKGGLMRNLEGYFVARKAPVGKMFSSDVTKLRGRAVSSTKDPSSNILRKNFSNQCVHRKGIDGR
jgi:hypothetical protein